MRFWNAPQYFFETPPSTSAAFAGWTCPCRSWESTSTTCDISMLKSYIECKYICLFLKLKQHVKGKHFFSVAEPKQYCWPNKFNATCPDSHVILIHSAKYGRMSRGICLKNTDISIGCQADVLTEVNLSFGKLKLGDFSGDRDEDGGGVLCK